MIWKDLFTTYGSYITLILLGIGYLIKRVYDLRSKRIELSYSFFQEHRIKTIIKFLDNYSKVDKMWNSLSLNRIVSGEMDTKELDNTIWPVMEALKATVLELMLYLSEEEYKPFETMYANMLRVDDKLKLIYFHHHGGNPIQMKKHFAFELNRSLNDNVALLRLIGKATRESFHIDSKPGFNYKRFLKAPTQPAHPRP